MRTDSDIKNDVENLLRLDRDIDATRIAVTVRDGVVMLTGIANSSVEKMKAADSAKYADGAAAIANDIQVHWPSSSEPTGPEIVRNAVDAIQRELPYSGGSIMVTSSDGWVTLEGHVERDFLRREAETAVRRLPGMKGVTNLITLRPPAASPDIKEMILESFRRHVELDVQSIVVEADDDSVTLKGTVRSLAEREEVERAVRSTPGVAHIENRLVVRA